VELGDPRLGDLSRGEAVSASLHDIQQGGPQDPTGEHKNRSTRLEISRCASYRKSEKKNYLRDDLRERCTRFFRSHLSTFEMLP